MGNQRRGYDAELRCMDTLQQDGFIVFRSAASKGPFDIIGIGDGGTYLIQVKRTKDRSRRRHRGTVRELQKFGKIGKARIQVWVWIDRTGWYLIDLLDDGTTFERWMENPKDYQSHAKIPGIPLRAPELGLEMRLDA